MQIFFFSCIKININLWMLYNELMNTLCLYLAPYLGGVPRFAKEFSEGPLKSDSRKTLLVCRGGFSFWR